MGAGQGAGATCRIAFAAQQRRAEKSNVATAIITPTAPVLNNDRRIALVIGNSAYENAAALPNPERDANLVADALKRTGFETVILLTNLRKDALVSALRDFAARAETADWAVVYYAGHGMEVGGINYLIPTDTVERAKKVGAVPPDCSPGSKPR